MDIHTDFPGSSAGKESAVIRDLGLIPGLGRSLGEGMAAHSSILAWRIPWTEEPVWLQSMGLQELDTTEWLSIVHIYMYTHTPYNCMPYRLYTHCIPYKQQVSFMRGKCVYEKVCRLDACFFHGQNLIYPVSLSPIFPSVILSTYISFDSPLSLHFFLLLIFVIFVN